MIWLAVCNGISVENSSLAPAGAVVAKSRQSMLELLCAEEDTDLADHLG